MNKEDMINILNQHGFDVLYEVFQDSISHAYSDGFSIGYDDGWNECYAFYEINRNNEETGDI